MGHGDDLSGRVLCHCRTQMDDSTVLLREPCHHSDEKTHRESEAKISRFPLLQAKMAGNLYCNWLSTLDTWEFELVWFEAD